MASVVGEEEERDGQMGVSLFWCFHQSRSGDVPLNCNNNKDLVITLQVRRAERFRELNVTCVSSFFLAHA